MNLSMYDASIPHLKRMLTNLSRILKKAEDFANGKGFDPDVLVSSRLFPDMFALAKQIQIATDQAKGGAARLAGIEIPVFDDKDATFYDLQGRIARTLAFLESIRPEQIDGSEDKDIVYLVHGKPIAFVGKDYLFEWVLPHFYFHLVTAYNILRHNGVEIGKSDYIGRSI